MASDVKTSLINKNPSNSYKKKGFFQPFLGARAVLDPSDFQAESRFPRSITLNLSTLKLIFILPIQEDFL